MTKRPIPASRSPAVTGQAAVLAGSAPGIGTDDLAALHLALLVIARSLARQAAAEMFRASLAADTVPEAPDE
jgi:hypothetical protein